MTQVNPTAQAAAPVASQTRAGAAKKAAEGVMGIKPLQSVDDVLHLGRRELPIGAVANVPFEALMASQAYRKGDLDAKEYAGKVIGNSIGFTSWTIAGALAATGLAAVGAGPIVMGVGGFAAGMLGLEVWNRTLGPGFNAAIGNAVPEGLAKPVAEGFTRFIANPFVDYIWNPAKNFVLDHKLITAIGLGALALKFPGAARAVGGQVGLMAGGTAVGLAATHFLLNPILPSKEEKDAEPAKAKSALGELDAQIRLDEQSRGLVHKLYPEEFKAAAGLPAQAVSDLEKVLYLRALAQSTQNPAEAQQLDAASKQLGAQVASYWSEELEGAAPKPAGKPAAPKADPKPAKSGRESATPAAVGPLPQASAPVQPPEINVVG